MHHEDPEQPEINKHSYFFKKESKAAGNRGGREVAAAKGKLSGWQVATRRRASVGRRWSKLHNGPELVVANPAIKRE